MTIRRADEDVVGAAEAAEILRVEPQRISVWQKKGRLPLPYAALKCSPIWLRTDIERVRDGATDGFTIPPEEPPLVATYEAADLLGGVDKAQIGRWLRAPSKRGPVFPEPAVEIAAGRLWRREDILEFARQRADQRKAAA